MARKLQIEEMNRLSAEEYIEAPKRAAVVVLDNVRSMHNVGAIFRTADALRFSKIWLCGITGTPPHAEIHKSALGAEEVVEWDYADQTVTAIQQIKEEGFEVWALEQAEGSIEISDWRNAIDTTKPIALVLGNEVEGVDQEVIDLCDGVVEIEQYGTKHSINVSVAGGIAMWNISQMVKL